MHDNVWNDFFVKSMGLVEYTQFLTNGVLQLANRYPHMNIIEIGK